MNSNDVAVATPSDETNAERPDRSLAEQLVDQAKADGRSLVGPGGLLADLTKQVLETGLEVEMEDHVGYAKHAAEGRNLGNSRNGTRAKTVITEVGPVELDVPRDRDGTFEPLTVRKGQRRLDGVDAMVISLTAKGLTTGEVEAHLAEVYSTDISRETISKITDRVLGDMAEWQTRPLDRVYPVVFIDAIVVKIRDGQVANRPVYTAIGVTVDGKRDILGLWVGTGGEGAKYWLQVLTEIKNRGVDDVCIVVCDGLKGLPESIEATWPLAVVQTCVLHLIRNTFRLASRVDWDKMARDLRPVYTAVNEADAARCLDEFHTIWGNRYPAIKTLWANAWSEFVPFLDYRGDPSSDLLDERDRVAERQVPSGDPGAWALPQRASRVKCLYLVVRSLDPKGTGQERWMNRWKPALNAFAITFEGRLF